MNTLLKYFIFTVLLFELSLAKGAPAGTSITNRAMISYMSGGVDYNGTSNEVTDVVDQLIDLKMEWIDMSPIVVERGESQAILTFRLANIGNGEDRFVLTHAHDKNSTFRPKHSKLYQDSNENGVYDASDEQIHNVKLIADTTVTLFLLLDVSKFKSDKSAIVYESLQARSTMGGSSKSDSGAKIKVVKGLKGGVDSAMGNFKIFGYRLNLAHSAMVENQFGSNEAIRGAIVTYSIDLSIEGIGEIENIIIRDAIPKGTIYQSESLTLDGSSLSDGIDGDVGSFNGEAIKVNIGSMKQTKTVIPKQKISFKVKIK